MTRAVGASVLILFAAFARCPDGIAASGRAAAPRERVVKALNAIFPEVEFRGASLSEVVSFLSEKGGVNIIVDPSVYAQAVSPPPTAATEEGRTGGVERPRTAAPAEPGGITLHLKNVPLKVVLKYVLRYKNLRYIVEDYAIVILPMQGAVPEEMVTQVFRLRTASSQRPRPVAQQGGGPF